MSGTSGKSRPKPVFEGLQIPLTRQRLRCAEDKIDDMGTAFVSHIAASRCSTSSLACDADG